MYNVKGCCVLCGQGQYEHENFAKCHILLDMPYYSQNGVLTERGKERAKTLMVKIIKHEEDPSS